MYSILIVEDDDTIRDLMQLALEDEVSGCIVQTAATGHAFLTLLQTHRPDLILLDMLLPDATGVALYQRLRQDANLVNVPVLFVTATPHLVWQAALEGQYACLAKPFALDSLVDLVHAVLGTPSAALALTA